MAIQCFADHPGQPLEAPKDQDRKKKGGGKTVSSYFKGQLDDLMTTLYKTEPHFIRCVVPNTHKQPGGVEPGLIMHQYRCNGVLAGIAICRKVGILRADQSHRVLFVSQGFPNKMNYREFRSRYNILAAQEVARAKNDKSAAREVLQVIKLDAEKFRLGHTKVFFRAGVLGYMEEVREERLATVLAWLQAAARGKAARMKFSRLQEQKLALYCVQRTVRNHVIARTWRWMQLWLLIKPSLKCLQFSKFKAEFEKKIALGTANIEAAVAECEAVTEEHRKLEADKQELQLALKSGGSAVEELVDKTNRLEASKNDLQKQVADLDCRIQTEEDLLRSLEQSEQRGSAEGVKLREEVGQLERAIDQCEEDKTNKDDQIKSLREEITNQEDLIGKMMKEKKGTSQDQQKIEEDIQALEDRSLHLNKIKNKLEQSLDESEDCLEREKKAKSDIEKSKRKTEMDLKLVQEAINDFEHHIADLTLCQQRKDKEAQGYLAKIEDESSLGNKYSKQVKELADRISEIEEELLVERTQRGKAEKSRAVLSEDLADIINRLEEAGADTSVQIELNKAREAEMLKLKAELEEANLAAESQTSQLRSRHNKKMGELGQQIDNESKMKTKAERDKAKMEMDLTEAKSCLDEAMRERNNVEKASKLTLSQIVDANNRLDEVTRSVNEAEVRQKILGVENQDVQRQIEELDKTIANFSKQKISLTTQLEDTKRFAEAETRERAGLLSKYKSLASHIENLKVRIEDEVRKKADGAKALSRHLADVTIWKSKYENEGITRLEELESNKSKILARLSESEETIESINKKLVSNEKSILRSENIITNTVYSTIKVQSLGEKQMAKPTCGVSRVSINHRQFLIAVWFSVFFLFFC